MEQTIFKELKRQRRKASTSYTIMVFCVAVAVATGWMWWSTSQRLDATRGAVEQRQQTIAIQQVQAHALHTLLRKEQAVGGGYEAKYLNWRDRAQTAEGHWGYWKRTAGDRADRICMLEQMLRDNGVRLYQRSECGE